MRRLAPLLCSTLLAALAWSAAAPAAPHGPDVGDLAPALLGEDPDGRPVTLDAWRGKPVVVAFWNSQCRYCLVEVPTLENLQQQLGRERLQVVVVNLNDAPRDWKAMLRQMRGFQLVQARDATGGVAASWGVQMFPNLWLVDAAGRVQRHHEGYLEDALPGILEEIRRAALTLPSPVP
jgi:thiol-disulfide isomerase/thioredoxin